MKTVQGVICLIIAVFHIASVQPARGAGVTVITHGWGGETDGWVEAMANAVAERMGGTGQVAQYTLKLESNLGTIRIASFTRDPGSPVFTNLASGELIIKLCWSDLDGGACPVIEPTWNIARLVSAALRSSNVASDGTLPNSVAELPLHLIGHSRGASLLGEVCRLLGTNGLWVDHFTMLDPHPIDCVGLGGLGIRDAPMGVATNVLFADNYYRQDTDPTDFNGESVSGAKNRYLDDLTGGHQGLLGADHSDVHLWYHGTIDLRTPVSYVDDGKTLTITSGMRAAWWTSSENRGTNTGYYFGRISGGTLNGGTRPVGPNEGLRFAGAAREPTTVATSGANTWDNVQIVDLTSDRTVTQGSAFGVQLYYEDRNRDATIEIGLDTDANPYNGISQTLSTIGTTFLNRDSIEEIYDTSFTTIPSGNYFIYAKITNGTHMRFSYATGRLILVSEPNGGLVAYYPFNGNANDASGNGRHAIPTNGTALAADRTGSPNRAYSFDGVDDHIIANPFTGFPTDQITCTFWVNGLFETDRQPTTVSYAASGEDNEFVVFDTSNLIIHISNPVNNLKTGVRVDDGRWHHVGVTWRNSDGDLRVYKDGTLAFNTNAHAGQTMKPVGSLVLGADQDDVGSGFDAYQRLRGKLEEVRIYNRVLSATEIAQLAFGRPEIVTQPLSRTVNEGNSVSFSVGVNGSPPFFYQWRLNGSILPNRTNSTYALSSAQVANAGSYSVVVSNLIGSVASVAANLIVCTSPQLISPSISAAGLFTMTIQAEAGCLCQVEKTTNLNQGWVSVTTLANPTGQVQFSELTPPGAGSWFYRVRPGP